MKSMTSLLKSFLILMLAQTGIQHIAYSQHHDDTTSNKQPITTAALKKSIPMEEHVQIGNAHLTIKYNSPGVRGRIIWGGLVPYGEVWVTGAHNATSFEINKNFIINGKEIPAGKYALFTIPGKEKWTVIVNKNWDQHLTDEYTEKDDLVRFDVPSKHLETLQERLKYTITPTSSDSAALSIGWEKIEIMVPFQIK
jgi:hypothetical protein